MTVISGHPGTTKHAGRGRVNILGRQFASKSFYTYCLILSNYLAAPNPESRKLAYLRPIMPSSIRMYRSLTSFAYLLNGITNHILGTSGVCAFLNSYNSQFRAAFRLYLNSYNIDKKGRAVKPFIYRALLVAGGD